MRNWVPLIRNWVPLGPMSAHKTFVLKIVARFGFDFFKHSLDPRSAWRSYFEYSCAFWNIFEINVGPTECSEDMIFNTINVLTLFCWIEVRPMERQVGPTESPEGIMLKTIKGFSNVLLNRTCVHGAPTKHDFVEG